MKFFLSPKQYNAIHSESTDIIITERLPESDESKDQRIKELEDALRDMGEALEFYSNPLEYTGGYYNSVLNDAEELAMETLQKHKALLAKINEEKKG